MHIRSCYQQKNTSKKQSYLYRKKICFFELFYQKIVSTSTYIVARFLNYPVYFVIFYRNNDNSLREVFNRSNYRFYLK